MTRGMSNNGKRMIVEPTVVEVLRGSMGVVVTLDDLMARLPKGANPASVRGVMRRLVEGDKMDVTVISRGQQLAA